MESVYLEIIQSLVLIAIYILVKGVAVTIVNRTMSRRLIQKSRGKIIKKAINTTLLFLLVVLILTVWGVKQADLSLYIGSILTVVGVAFFAQWSILSNITSSIIIFFNHSVKLEDHIIIMEGKDYEIAGRVSDIGIFFVTIKTENDEEITIPNNLFIGKTIKKKL